MITDWKVNYSGERYYLSCDLTIGGFNINGKEVHIYYYYYSYDSDRSGSATYKGPYYMGKFTPPTTIEKAGRFYCRYRQKYSKVYYLITNKKYDVSNLLDQVPLKFWYGFGFYSSSSYIRPSTSVYQPRR